MPDVRDLPRLERRERAAYSVLALGVLGLALASVSYYELSSLLRGTDVLTPLGFGLPPYALAAHASWRARASWDATSWLFESWVFLVGATLWAQFHVAVLSPEYGLFGDFWVFLLPVAQTAVVLFSAGVALVLHRRELRGR